MSGLVDNDKDQYGHPRIPYRGHYDRKHCDERRTWIETFCNCNLTHVGEWWNNEGKIMFYYSFSLHAGSCSPCRFWDRANVVMHAYMYELRLFITLSYWSSLFLMH